MCLAFLDNPVLSFCHKYIIITFLYCVFLASQYIHRLSSNCRRDLDREYAKEALLEVPSFLFENADFAQVVAGGRNTTVLASSQTRESRSDRPYESLNWQAGKYSLRSSFLSLSFSCPRVFHNKSSMVLLVSFWSSDTLTATVRTSAKNTAL